jgi:hypothetical protein
MSLRRLIALTGLLVAWTTCPALTWFDGSRPVSYHLLTKTDAVVQTALHLWHQDMMAVTGMEPHGDQQRAVIQVVQLNKADKRQLHRLTREGLPTRLAADGFFLGVSRGHLWVVGADGRGTAYGLLELSRQAGVSPWVWWGDVVPERQQLLTIADDFSMRQEPSITYRGVFINDEDWSFRPWSMAHGGLQYGYRHLFGLLLRLRANTLWPAMHEGTPSFFTIPGAKEMADSFGIVIGTSHCEPLLRNNVGEWDTKQRGPYNYMTNRQAVEDYWAERLQESRGGEYLYTIGMRGIHDGRMEGVGRDLQQQTEALQQVIDRQRQMLSRYVNRDASQVPQVFVPYKEVLEVYENGLHVPDDVTLMWCDDNYGYLTRLSDEAQQRRSGGAGVYYHLSYWGRPHDYLWLTTTQPGLIYEEMRQAYDHQARRLWIANVHDPKVAAYDLELFLDMAWNIDAITPSILEQHLERWLCRQFGQETGHLLTPAMKEYYRLCAIRRPEFMGWTQVELDKRKYPRGLSPIEQTAFTAREAADYLTAYDAVCQTVRQAAAHLRPQLRDAYFAAVEYPVLAAREMARKLLADTDSASDKALQHIQKLTIRYNRMKGGKWNRLMDAAPRRLPVFGQGRFRLETTTDSLPVIARNAADYTTATKGVQRIQMLGHSMAAVSIPRGGSIGYNFQAPLSGKARLWVALIPTQPNDRGDLRYAVAIDGGPETVISLKEPFRSERWKQNVLRGQSLRHVDIDLSAGPHTLTLRALDDHIITDQWMLDFNPERKFYVIPSINK